MMGELYNIKLHKDSDTPMYQQIGDALCLLIEDGALAPNTKLPPIRTMAKGLGVNNITVVNAYKYLENKRVVYSHMGSGTYVSEITADALSGPMPEQFSLPGDNGAIKETAINFADTSASTDLFPVEDFKNFLNEVLTRDGGEAFSYQDNQGYLPLRESICWYVSGYGIKTSADKIQIISGAQQGIDLISKALLSTGDVLFAEKPTYYGAIGAFLSRGGQIVEIGLSNDGMDMAELEACLRVYRPKFIYVMPYFQTPTGIKYSLEKKRRLLALADKYNTYIIEEDNQSDFNFTDESVVPLKALDYKNRVVYIKSFSKIMMPGLRLGFMILPKAILNKIRDVKYTTDISTSGFIQRTFDLYLRSDLWEKRIHDLKEIFYKRYIAMAEAVRLNIDGMAQYTLPEGGLSLWLKIDRVKINLLCDELTHNNVLVTPGEVFSLSGSIPYIKISFASADEESIEKGVKIIGEILRKLCR